MLARFFLFFVWGSKVQTVSRGIFRAMIIHFEVPLPQPQTLVQKKTNTYPMEKVTMLNDIIFIFMCRMPEKNTTPATDKYT
jgi:hypothetical protein